MGYFAIPSVVWRCERMGKPGLWVQDGRRWVKPLYLCVWAPFTRATSRACSVSQSCAPDCRSTCVPNACGRE